VEKNGGKSELVYSKEQTCLACR